jgi:hypothetical protein
LNNYLFWPFLLHLPILFRKMNLIFFLGSSTPFHGIRVEDPRQRDSRKFENAWCLRIRCAPF